MFVLNNVRFKDILFIENLRIPQNKISCIVGESGSGKTTLLRLLNKMISPTEGKIFFQNQSIDEMDSIALRRSVLMLPQTPAIFDGSIRDNLLIGLRFSQKPLASDADLRKILSMVNLMKELDSDAEKLSGGEKQRLALGRVILMKPSVYLLDEPSASLDENTEKIIIEKLAQHVKETDRTLIMVTHSKAVAENFADNIIEVKNGRIAV